MENKEKILSEKGMSFVKDLAKTKIEITSIIAKCESRLFEFKQKNTTKID